MKPWLAVAVIRPKKDTEDPYEIIAPAPFVVMAENEAGAIVAASRGMAVSEDAENRLEVFVRPF